MNREQRGSSEAVTVNDDLTIFERGIDWYQEGLPDTIAKSDEHDVFVRAKLTKLTRQIMERHYAKLQAKKKPRKRYSLRGRYHHQSKKATQKRLQKRRWKDNPFGCIIHGWGAYSVDKALFAQYIAPLWEQYDPELLTVKKHKKDLDGVPFGTVSKPYTIYSLVVHHPVHGVLFDGLNQKIYDLQVGSL